MNKDLLVSGTFVLILWAMGKMPIKETKNVSTSPDSQAINRSDLFKTPENTEEIKEKKQEETSNIIAQENKTQIYYPSVDDPENKDVPKTYTAMPNTSTVPNQVLSLLRGLEL